MDQKLISIYVGNDVTRVCEVVKKSATSILVNNATEVATPAGSYEDGYILDVSSIAEAIRGCVFGKGFNATKAIFTISSKKIANKEVVLPYVRGDKKIAGVLNANATEYFPMAATGNFVFAHNVMETYQDEEGKKIRINAVAAPQDLVEGYYELANELRLSVENIDYVGNSVLQLLSLQMKDTDTELVLQIEKDVTYVNVMSGKDVILQRSVPYGKNAVVNSIMEIKKLTEKDAKTLLSNKDMIDRQVTEEEYSEAVRYLISSIGRIVEYHRSRNPERIIDGIKVFGEGSAIAGIDEVLQAELGATVTRFDTLQGVKVSGKAYLTSDSALRYLANFGAVLNPIGLKMDDGRNKEQASAAANKILIAILIVAAVIMIGVVAFFEVKYYMTLAVKKGLEVGISEMEVAEEIANQYQETLDAYNVVKLFDDSTHTDNNQLEKFIVDLEKVLPSGTVVTGFKCENGIADFEVGSITKEQVAEVLIQLKKLDYVSDVVIPSIDVDYVEADDEDENSNSNDTEEEDFKPTYEIVTYEFMCTLTDLEYDPSAVEGVDPNAVSAVTESEVEE